jgi:Ca2+-binding EF-hand superfamily protein
VNVISLSPDEVTQLRNKTHFDVTEIQILYEQFKTLAPEEKGITRDAFNQCLGALGRQTNLVMDRMFLFYDQNEDGVISFDEFVSALSILVKGGQDEKLKFVFEGYDLDRKGYLVYKDFHDMFKAYFNVSIELVKDYIKTYEEEMRASFDETGDKPVSSVFHAPIPTDAGSGSGADVKSLQQQPRSGTAGSGGAQPLMEAMSQDAIDEMVANVFKCADLNEDGKITFDEFKAWAVLDNTILAWFDALGTVF